MTKRIITLLYILLPSFVLTYAQNDDTEAVADTMVEAVDMPEGMLVADDDLMSDFNNKRYLTPGTAITRNLSYDDSIIVDRLSRIPTTIEMPLNNVTRKFIDTYSNRLKSSVSVMLGAANFYVPIFEEALERYGVPLELKYLPVIESALRPSATSRVGAAGLWQFMVTTGKRYGLEVNTLVDERRDPVKSSDAAARYLRDLYNQFGDWGLAIAAYNCGEGNINKALIRNGKQEGADYWDIYNRLPHETRGYVPAFIAANYIMNYYCEHGITPHESILPVESDTVVVLSDVKLDQIARVCNLSVDELRAINPQYRRDIVPRDYVLRLPASSIEAFLVNEDSIYGRTSTGDYTTLRRSVIDDLNQNVSESRNTGSSRSRRGRSSSSSGKTVAVRSGDTLSAIAKRNGTTVAKLRRLNGMSGSMIRPGQKIKVK